MKSLFFKYENDQKTLRAVINVCGILEIFKIAYSFENSVVSFNVYKNTFIFVDIYSEKTDSCIFFRAGQFYKILILSLMFSLKVYFDELFKNYQTIAYYK